MLSQAMPAAFDAAGRKSSPLEGLSFFLVRLLLLLPLLLELFFFESLLWLLRSVVSIGFRLSGLDPRDIVLADEFECARSVLQPDPELEPAAAATAVVDDEEERRSSFSVDPELFLGNVPASGGGLDKSI